MNKYPTRNFHRLIHILIAIIFGFTISNPSYSDENSNLLFEQAIIDARNGDHNKALSILKQLTEEHPEIDQYRNDYITVLCWAKKYTTAFAFFSDINLLDTPIYVIENLAEAAIQTKHFNEATILYSRLLQLESSNRENHYRYAWSLIETGMQNNAFDAIKSNSISEGDYISQLHSLANYLADINAYAASLIVFNKLVTLTDDTDIHSNRLLLLSESGATALADNISTDHPGLLTSEEKTRITGDYIATHIAWGRLPDIEHSKPFYETDTAIVMLRQQLKELQDQETIDDDAIHRASYDLLEALHDRGDNAEIILMHQEMVRDGNSIPDYALVVIAQAYQELRKPKQAKDIYESLLQAQPNNYYIQFSLFYCLIDLEEFDQAIALIDSLAAAEAPWNCSAAALCEKNDRKLQADIAAAMVRAYAERPDLAEARIKPLYAKAPFNLDLQLTIATLNYWRNKSHLALDNLDLIRTQEPLYYDAASSRFNILMAMMDYREAYQQLAEMAQIFSTNKILDKNVNSWQQHNRRELNIDINRSTNTSSVIGSRDLVINSHLYAQPLHFVFRPFFHSYNAQSKIPEGYVHYHRIGVGLEYRIRDFILTTEIHSNIDAGKGLSVDSRWTPIDHWVFGAHVDTNDVSIPLRGRFNENIKGHAIGINGSYVHNEQLRIDSSYQRLSFSDNNIRKNMSLSANKRLIAKPHYFLNATLGYFGSSNSRQSAPYYNPPSDNSIELGLLNEWIQYRFYNDSFRHRLATSIGQYNQSGFAAKGIWTISYEQQWNLLESLELVYGLGRSQRSYDAAKEYNNWLMMRLNWRF